MIHVNHLATAALIGSLVWESLAVAQATPNDKKVAIELRELVGSLANRDKPPRTSEGHVREGSTVDEAEQKRVWKAIQGLIERAEEAWPMLVAHLDDGRYSVTVSNEIFGTEANWTIGDVCREIVGRTLSQAYYEKLQPESLDAYRRLRIPTVALNGKDLKKWCVARSQKKLYELQMEMCESASRQIEKGDGDFGVDDDVRNGWVKEIGMATKSLSKSRRPVIYEGFGLEEITPYRTWSGGDPFAVPCKK